MRRYTVSLDPSAIRDLTQIYDYIAERASSRVAEGFVERLREKCASLADAPLRGTVRSDLGAGLRTFGVERRATVLFSVDRKKAEVLVLAVFYGGREISP